MMVIMMMIKGNFTKWKKNNKDEIRVQNLGLLVSQLMTHGSKPWYLSEPFCSLCSQNNCCSWMFIPQTVVFHRFWPPFNGLWRQLDNFKNPSMCRLTSASLVLLMFSCFRRNSLFIPYLYLLDSEGKSHVWMFEFMRLQQYGYGSIPIWVWVNTYRYHF